MAVRGRSLLSWPTLLGTLFSHARLAIRLIRDPSVSWFSKALPVLATLYVVSPFDLVPDVIPVLGQLDDGDEQIAVAEETVIEVVCGGLVRDREAAPL